MSDGIYIADFRSASNGGAVVPAVLSRIDTKHDYGARDALARASRVTFLIHGFNVNRQEGETSLSRLARELAGEVEGALVGVLWPGDSWAGPLGYSFEAPDAQDTASELSRFVALTWPALDRLSISFVAHSKGSRVAMSAARRLFEDHGMAPDRVCLLAAAIDDTSLAEITVYRTVTAASTRVAVLSSTRDWVLWGAYPAGDLLQSFIYAGERSGWALGYAGPRQGMPHPASVLSTRIDPGRGVGHGDYLPPSTASRINKKQRDGIAYARAILKGETAPEYGAKNP